MNIFMKKVWIMALSVVTAFSLCACGKTKAETKQAKMEKEIAEMQEELEEADDIWTAMEKEEEIRVAEQELQEEIQGGYKLYDRLPELDTAESPFLVTQIDDSLYKVGQSVKEIIETIDNSEVEYCYDQGDYGSELIYVPTKIVEGNSLDCFWVKRDGESWFEIYYYNPTDDVVSIDDCICFRIDVCKDARPFSRVLGLEPSEWEAMTYADVEALAEEGNLLSGFSAEKESGSSTTHWTFNGTVIVNQGDCAYVRGARVWVYVDMNTGMVSDYSIDLEIPVTTVSSDSISEESFANVLEEAKDVIMEEAEIYCVDESYEYKVKAIYYTTNANRDNIHIYAEFSNGEDSIYAEAWLQDFEIENGIVVNQGRISAECLVDLEALKEYLLQTENVIWEKEF